MRDRAALGALLWPTGDADAQGYEEIEARAASAYEHWVGSEGLSFRRRDDAEWLGDVVESTGRRSPRTARRSESGSTSSSSPRDSRIERDYTFVVA